MTFESLIALVVGLGAGTLIGYLIFRFVRPFAPPPYVEHVRFFNDSGKKVKKLSVYVTKEAPAAGDLTKEDKWQAIVDAGKGEKLDIVKADMASQADPQASARSVQDARYLAFTLENENHAAAFFPLRTDASDGLSISSVEMNYKPGGGGTVMGLFSLGDPKDSGPTSQKKISTTVPI